MRPGDFSAASFDSSIAGTNWVARALDLTEFWPVDGPLPPAFQSGRSADFDVYLPDAAGGEFAAGDAFISAAVALDAQYSGGVNQATQVEAIRAITPQSMTTYSVDIPAGVSTVFSFNNNRSYLLVVNAGANACQIAYGRDADATSLNLAGGSVGFHELINGTVSSLSVFAAVGLPTRLVITEGTFYPPVYQ